jgi:hypothetical protein
MSKWLNLAASLRKWCPVSGGGFYSMGFPGLSLDLFRKEQALPG